LYVDELKSTASGPF